MSPLPRSTDSLDGSLQCSDNEFEPIIEKETDMDIYGDCSRYKFSSDIRIGFLNVHGFPEKDMDKYDRIKDMVCTNMLDVLGTVENNTFWPKSEVDNNIHELTYDWWRKRSVSVAYNKHTCRKLFQPGGCAVISSESMIGRHYSSGVDSDNLGRWAWSLYRGKNNIRVRIISLYNALRRPTHGATTVYNQQKQYYRKNDIVDCPMVKLKDDIITNLSAWMNQGEQIVLMMDTNENIINPTRTGLVKALYDIGLKDAIISHHGGTPPNTYNRGHHPIDGIFVSPTINIRQGGYDRFQEFSDHCLLWIDMETEVVFGEFMYKSKRPNVRRLRYNDPKARKKFYKKLNEHFVANNLYQRSIVLDNSIGYYATEKQQSIAEKLIGK